MMNLLKKILIYPFQLWVWLVFAPLLAALTLLFALFALVLIPIAGPTAASRFAGVPWARMICYATPVWVRTRGREHLNQSQSYIIVANHQSQYDIVVLYGWLGIDFRWVMKKELRKVPGLGIACEKIGHIFIDRSNTKKALESLEAAKQTIVRGVSVIFFPEGTRSKTGRLGTFKLGAFKMAKDLGLPILPVTISGTRELLKTKSLLIWPGKAEMTIHPPIPIDGLTEREMMEKVHAVMSTALSQ
jgi:1-acyl-sn-glycerol-3-phosphate acyltransferase